MRSPTVAIVVLALGAGAVVWSLVRFWGTSPDYADRFLVLAASAWLGWRGRAELAALPTRPTAFGWLSLLLGAVAFPVGWHLQAQVAPRPVLLWWLALSWLAAVAGTTLLLGGPVHLRRLAFPLTFALFALPIPNRVLVPLQSALQTATTAAAAATLPAVGVPVVRSGFVLSLPNGDLGVAEACSGVRSVTALAAIAAFVAYRCGFGPGRGLALLMLTVPVIAAVNAARVVVSGVLLERVGPRYVTGDWHEALGAAMVLLGLALVLGLARCLRARKIAPFTVSRPRGGAKRQAAALPTTIVLVLSTIATMTAHLLGSAAERDAVAAAPLEQLPHTLGPWAGTDAAVPDYVVEMLTPDAILHRRYTRDLGYEADVWVVFWSSRNMVKGYHHPDVCWPNRGFRIDAQDVIPVRTAAGGSLPVTVREFRRNADRHLILYWTQEGRHVWTAADEERVKLAGDSHDWLAERLSGDASSPSGRLVVLVGTPTSGDGQLVRAQTLAFVAQLADELHRLCPWAALHPPDP